MRYISIFFIILLCACSLIRIKNAPIVIKEQGNTPATFHAVVETSGYSGIFKELSRSNIYLFHIYTQNLKESSSNLDSIYIHESQSFNVYITSSKKLAPKQRIGYIDYEVKLTKKGALIICTIWIICLLIVMLRNDYKNKTKAKIYPRCQMAKLEYMGKIFTNTKQNLALIPSLSFRELCNKIHIAITRLENSNISLHLLLVWFAFIIFCIFFYTDSIIIRDGGAYLGSNDSGDMQWYPAVQLFGLHGLQQSLNPYYETLNGNYFLANKPNYAHLLYVIMYPFAMLEYDVAKIWYCAFNNLCIIITCYLFYREILKRQIPFTYFAIFTMLFFLSEVYAAAIYRGNIPLVIALFVTLAFIYRHNPIICGICLSIVCVKYTFGIPLIIGFLLARFYVAACLACIIHIVVIATFAWHFNIGFIESLFLPILVGREHASSMIIDILSLARTTFSGLNLKNPFVYLLIACFIIWTYCTIKFKTSKETIILSSIVISFCLFQHHIYDYTLVICLAFIGLFACSGLRFFILICYCLYILIYMDFNFYTFGRFEALCYSSLLYAYAIYIVCKKEESCLNKS
ncbi:DUF2029 domain-containing protein [Helicobacter muridarum]|uniref:DUF2029 domain-containing protein n=1 Tax=Helicobacter muridarum TaxID=216 RepID=A0A377PUC6_9HELI|nr:glycosyltransferase 87 family protein [Helicobacter muridarum]TLE01628.1 DUF2029 domain-containing protein [Helicobacter muridarum]STQ86245.1 Protein of uncharacterised function (DUF2029) [Helicobacter muridarum]